MGSQVVTQTLDIVSSISESISNNAESMSSEAISVANILDLDGCNNVVIENVTQENIVKIDTEQYTSIVQEAYSSANIQANAEQAALQIKALLDLSAQDTEEAERLVANILIAENNSFMSSCSIDNSVTNNIICTTSSKDLIIGDAQENFVDSINNCITNDSQVSEAVAALKQFAEQKSTQVQLGLFGPLYAIILLIVIVVIVVGIIILAAIFGYFSEGSLVLYIIIIFGLILLSFYFVIAFFPKWWPYQLTSDLEDDDITSSAEHHNHVIFYTALGLMVLFMIFVIVLIIENEKRKNN